MGAREALGGEGARRAGTGHRGAGSQGLSPDPPRGAAQEVAACCRAKRPPGRPGRYCESGVTQNKGLLGQAGDDVIWGLFEECRGLSAVL